MSIVHRLRDYPLFANLSAAELAQLVPCLTKRSYAKGAYLFYPGNSGLNIYLIETGLVRLFFANTCGREFVLDLLGPCATIGLPLLREDQTRMTGAAALLPSSVWVMAQHDLNFFLQRYPQLMHNIYREMDVTLRKLMLYARGMATLSLKGRLATMLLYLCSIDFGQGIQNEINLPLSQAEIAGWVGASRGALNRALCHLQKLGLIRIEGQKYTILDRPGLLRIAEELLLDQE
jgi:CRP/FNR family transcriptional regulator